MGSKGQSTELPAVDLWAPVGFDDLPIALLAGAARSDWDSVRASLRVLMDAVTTDGPYGRALLQFVVKTHLPTDPVLERYRASICVDHGDWDGLVGHLSGSPVEAEEPIGVRDAI